MLNEWFSFWKFWEFWNPEGNFGNHFPSGNDFWNIGRKIEYLKFLARQVVFDALCQLFSRKCPKTLKITLFTLSLILSQSGDFGLFCACWPFISFAGEAMEGNWKLEVAETQKTVQTVNVKCIFSQCNFSCSFESMTSHIMTCSHSKLEFPFLTSNQVPSEKTVPCEGCGKHVSKEEKVPSLS